MQCPYCKKELIPFRIKIEGRKSNLIGWFCQCTDKIRDEINFINDFNREYERNKKSLDYLIDSNEWYLKEKDKDKLECTKNLGEAMRKTLDIIEKNRLANGFSYGEKGILNNNNNNNNITNDLSLEPITKMKKEMKLQSQGNVLNKAFYKDHPEEDVPNNKS